MADGTLAPLEEAKVPGVSLTGDGFYSGWRYHDRGMMETVAAILIAGGAVALIILALIFVVAAGWFIQAFR
jgi:hypothetical protein